ncbi:hypothetical protein BGZ54_006635 [Gamsiella multidivaricata]|nr:hypothetical protein BGZ54_006635 [Gamsiella multidivaricata]
MQQALGLQELLTHIASYLDKDAITRCCLVSKQWSQAWKPLCWRDIKWKEPRDFVRNGHLIRNLTLRMSSSSSSYRPVEEIRDHCPNLRSLHIVDFQFNRAEFEERVLGIQTSPSTTAASNAAAALQEGEKASSQGAVVCSKNPFIDSIVARNSYLSNSLHTLQFGVSPEVCAMLLPRLVQAKKAGRLQGLKSFRMGESLALGMRLEAHPSWHCTLKLSDILAFLDEFPDLTCFSTGDINIINDIGSEDTDSSMAAKDVSISSNEEGQQKRQREYKRMTELEISSSSSVVLEPILVRMPQLRVLKMGYIRDARIFPKIIQHFPNLTSLHLDLEYYRFFDRAFTALDLDQTNQDGIQGWIHLFEGLPALEHLNVMSAQLSLPILKSLTMSCPRLSSLKANKGSRLSVLGILFLLNHAANLRELEVSQKFDAQLFAGNQEPWKAPLERLHLEEVDLSNDEENDCFRNRMRQLPWLKSLETCARKISHRALLDEEENEVAAAANGVVPYPRLEKLIMKQNVSAFEGFISRLVNTMPRLNILELDEDYSKEDIQIARRGRQDPTTAAAK